MHLFSRPEYRSEFTRFLEEFRQQNPSITDQQNAGLALLWRESLLDPDWVQRANASRVKRSAYPYE